MPHAPSIHMPCARCLCHTDHSLSRREQASGAVHCAWACDVCGKVGTHSGLYISKREALRHVKTIADLPLIPCEDKPRCDVCDADGAERHHFAPRALFGADADRWPTALLCVPCHRKWHSIVTPGMRKATPSPQPQSAQQPAPPTPSPVTINITMQQGFLFDF
jgi:hypothetical protein